MSENNFLGKKEIGAIYAGGPEVDYIFSREGLLYSSVPRVKVGKNYYKYVKIGDQLWTAENLKEPIGTVGTDSCWYNNDESYEELGFGMLYKWGAICSSSDVMSEEFAALMPEGWRLPSKDDWFKLCDAAGLVDGNSGSHKKLKSTTGWTGENGTDDYGFNAMPCGKWDVSFSAQGSLSMMWLSTEASSTYAHDIVLRGNGQFQRNYSNLKTAKYSVRLVKDV